MSDATSAPTAAGSLGTASVAPTAEVPQPSRTWDRVNQPGCYVCNDTGRLFRVPASALGWAGTPNMQLLGPQGPSRVTCLSGNPGLPIEELRLLSTSAAIQPRF